MSLIDTARHWWRHAENEERATTPTVPAPVESTPETSTQAGTQVAASAGTKTIGDAPYIKALEGCGLPRTLIYPSTTLSRLLDQTADRFGTATAIIYNHRTWTWEQIRQQVNRLAGGLATLGVRRGERVVMTLPNCPEFLIAFFAIQKLGAVLVNAGPLMGVDDLRQVLSMTSARVVIGLDLQSPILARAGLDSTVEHWVWVSLAFYQSVFKRLGYHLKLWQESTPRNNEQHISLNDLLDNAPSRPPTVEPDADRTAILQPTGGTTGGVKLVQLSHRNLLANATQVAVWAGARPGQERILAVLPMFHVYGLTSCLMTAVYGAHELIMLTRFSAEEVLELIHRYRPTILPIVPAMCDPICDALERETASQAKRHGNGKYPVQPARLDSVRACISGAAPLPPPIAERFTRVTGIELLEGYGLSEAAPVTHINPIGHGRAGSIGLPLPDTVCRIVDPEQGTIDVPAGEPGELLVHGPQVMNGYFSDAEQTQKTLSRDDQGRTWLHTGDIVQMETDGYFRVMDRKKDMIIRSGLKVYPAKVERVLRMHPQVKDVGVIGRPDLVHTEEVIAFVVTNGPITDRAAFTQSLRMHCREHLAPYEVPAKIEFLPTLPRSGLGKLLKKDLRLLESTAEPGASSGSTSIPVKALPESEEGPGNDPPRGTRPHSPIKPIKKKAA